MSRTGASRTKVSTGAARAVARLAKQVEVAIGPLDLSLPQYRVLGLLADGSTASSVLARQLAVSPPSVTAVVDGLVGRGLVERRADPEDRRRLTLLLTREGTRLLAAADTAAEARLDDIAGFLGEPSVALAAGLDGWNQALDRNREAHVKRGS
jgi:DNA-binding MarR family transcriptional regulator